MNTIDWATIEYIVCVEWNGVNEDIIVELSPSVGELET